MQKKTKFTFPPSKNDEGQKARFFKNATKKMLKTRLNLRQKKG